MFLALSMLYSEIGHETICPSPYLVSNSLSTLGPLSPLFPIPPRGARKPRLPRGYSHSGSRNETHSYLLLCSTMPLPVPTQQQLYFSGSIGSSQGHSRVHVASPVTAEGAEPQQGHVTCPRPLASG